MPECGIKSLDCGKFSKDAIRHRQRSADCLNPQRPALPTRSRWVSTSSQADSPGTTSRGIVSSRHDATNTGWFRSHFLLNKSARRVYHS